MHVRGKEEDGATTRCCCLVCCCAATRLLLLKVSKIFVCVCLRKRTDTHRLR